MTVFSHSDPEKGLFLPYLSSKLIQEIEIYYIDLVEASWLYTGSVFGPNMWNIVFEDILRVLDDTWTRVFSQCYADDTLLLIAADCPDQL